jgi:hypothetical protein
MIIDIDAIPPEGVSVIITNTTVAGSNSPVDVEEGGEGSDAVSITMGTTPEESDIFFFSKLYSYSSYWKNLLTWLDIYTENCSSQYKYSSAASQLFCKYHAKTI